MASIVVFFIITTAWVVVLFMTFSPPVYVIDSNTLEGGETQPEEKRGVTPADVAIYYETRCPFSRDFIIDKLLPQYLRAPELMNLSLVPYGNARTKVTPEGYEFKCQHGPVECQGNKIHSCAVELLQNQTQQLEYVACMMWDESDPPEIAKECADELGIEWEPILDCAEGDLGSELLRANGLRHRAVRPKLKGVPAITLNGVQQKKSIVSRHLLREVCKLLQDPKPQKCLEESSL